MSNLKIESGIEIPPPIYNRGLSETLKSMEVGQSVFIEGGTHSKTSSSTSFLRKRYGMRFTTRRQDNGVRIWRIA